MPRKRIIDPEYWLNGEIAKISDKARLLYIGSWNFADDNGILENDPEKIRVQIFPYEQLKIEDFLKELFDIKKFIPFESGGKRYIWIKNFRRYQVGIKYPSYRYPIPPPELLHNYGSTTVGFTIVEKSRVEKSNSKEEKSSEEKTFLNNFFPFKRKE